MSEISENCPICGKKMEKGYVTGGGPAIFWSEEEKKYLTTGAEILLGGRIKGTFANAKSYRCPDCKIVIFSYGKDT